jgi:hypothetical protein
MSLFILKNVSDGQISIRKDETVIRLNPGEERQINEKLLEEIGQVIKPYTLSHKVTLNPFVKVPYVAPVIENPLIETSNVDGIIDEGVEGPFDDVEQYSDESKIEVEESTEDKPKKKNYGKKKN